MYLFEFFTKLNHRKNRKAWTEATAMFTGRSNKVAVRTKAGYLGMDNYEYEIVYNVNGKRQTAWHSFFPLPDPGADELEGKTMRIKYNPKKPFDYECVEDDY